MFTGGREPEMAQPFGTAMWQDLPKSHKQTLALAIPHPEISLTDRLTRVCKIYTQGHSQAKSEKW